jgi:hypothetical protein
MLHPNQAARLEFGDLGHPGKRAAKESAVPPDACANTIRLWGNHLHTLRPADPFWITVGIEHDRSDICGSGRDC